MSVLKLIDTTPPEFIPEPITDEEAAAMLRASIALFKRWELSDAQAAVLLDTPLRTYARWKVAGPSRFGRDLKARLSNLMGIHKALRVMFREPQRGYGWIKRTNTAFGGQSPLEIMLGGDLTDLMRVRRYLDAERGAW